jgi:regulatory protein
MRIASRDTGVGLHTGAMRLAAVGQREGVESKRRGARNPATSDSPPLSRAEVSSARRPRARGTRSDPAPQLEPPIRITSVAEDPRVKGRVRVRCQAQGHTVTIVIGAAGVRAFGVRTGIVLDQVGWAALSREARVVHAHDAALRLLSTSRRSRRDLAVRLRRRESDPTVVADALARLDALGLLNDEEFARAEAAAQLRNGARSTGDVRRRLQQRGITGSDAAAAVAAVVESEGIDDAARCDAAAEKRARQLRSLAPDVAQRRLVGFLMRRGFGPGLVFSAARRALATTSGMHVTSSGDGDELGDFED